MRTERVLAALAGIAGWIDAAGCAREPGVEDDALPQPTIYYRRAYPLDASYNFMSQNLGEADKRRQWVVKAGVQKHLLDVTAADSTCFNSD